MFESAKIFRIRGPSFWRTLFSLLRIRLFLCGTLCCFFDKLLPRLFSTSYKNNYFKWTAAWRRFRRPGAFSVRSFPSAHLDNITVWYGQLSLCSFFIQKGFSSFSSAPPEKNTFIFGVSLIEKEKSVCYDDLKFTGCDKRRSMISGTDRAAGRTRILPPNHR